MSKTAEIALGIQQGHEDTSDSTLREISRANNYAQFLKAPASRRLKRGAKANRDNRKANKSRYIHHSKAATRKRSIEQIRFNKQRR